MLRPSLVAALVAAPLFAQPYWRPADGPLKTRWAAQVRPEAALPEYPRPQLRRDDWLNLNGLWEYVIAPREASRPASWQGRILVPFAAESALSGVAKPVTPADALWYRRTFQVPVGWRGRRTMLNFGAVDWQATVWVNGVRVGEHRGGFTPFSLDISRALAADGDQEIVVRAWDPSDTGTQPRGKQVLEPQGIWYTPVTGIWQTVWLEPVAETRIERLRLAPDLSSRRLRIDAVLDGHAGGLTLRATARDGSASVANVSGPAGATLDLPVANPKAWSPDSPHLYDLRLELVRGGQVLDTVDSYFAMREISLGRDGRGHQMLMLNGKSLFQYGPLDQGWWPDGLYTAPTDEALVYDLEVTKRLGFNMVRKHVKVEPARWYYHCDRLGLLVWQDLPNGHLGRGFERGLFVGPWDDDAPRTGESAAQLEYELREMIESLEAAPSIVMWVPFNEGWGQYDTERIARWVRTLDPTRLVNASSGWTDRGAGDVYDTHIYPGPGMQHGGPARAAVLGEFGGLGWPVEGHLWWDKRNWGYRTYTSREELGREYERVVGAVMGPIARGLAAAIYTQTTDVEGEVNGLMTYDREMVKFDEARLQALHAKFYAPPRSARVVLPAGHDGPQPWRLTTEKPPAGWEKPGFDDSRWRQGRAPLREQPDPLFANGDEWKSDAVWLRRKFTIDRVPANLWLEVLHTVTSGTVYLNGKKIDELDRFTRREYRHADLSAHLDALRPGENVIAVHAEVGQDRRPDPKSFDLGLYTVE